MRTILDLDEDILLAAKELAQRRQLSLGKALSELARRAMTQQDDAPTRHGVPLFPVRAEAYVVTFERVNQLRDEIL